MKIVCQKQRIYMRRRQLDRENRRLKHKDKVAFFRKYGFWKSSHPMYRRENDGRLSVNLKLPEILSLQTHYDEVMEFIDNIRKYGVRQNARVYADFMPLRFVGACGALLLAAELDRWRRLGGFRFRVDHKHWNDGVYRLLGEMGLFSFLDVTNPPAAVPVEADGMRFIQFRTRKSAKGEEFRLLADHIEKIAGPIPSRAGLYRGLTEAMTNVSNHAYPATSTYQTAPLRGQWWMAGSFDPKGNHLTVVFYDQGVGIPATLPPTHKMDKVTEVLNRLRLQDNDASRIRAAMEFGRSSTHAEHRGGGLFRDIRKYTDLIPNGRFRVLSGKGEYVYSPGEAEISDRESLISHDRSIGGTLIQWEGTLPVETS